MSSTRSLLLEALALFVALIAAPTLATGADDDRRARARAHFEEGQQAYNLGRFSEAVESYERSYQTLPLPELLFNLGQCHRQLGDDERAVFFYRRYLSESKAPANRALVEELIHEASRRIEAKKLATERPKEPEPPPPKLEPPPIARAAPVIEEEPEIWQRWWFWTIVGVAAIGAGGAVVIATRRGDSTPSGTFPPIDTR
jgi:tetratricopeptide (TPR) repeat protein